MTTVLIVCAALGGTVLVLQFLLTLVGLGGHGLDTEIPHDIGHGFGGDFHVETGGGLHGDAGFHGDHGGDTATNERGGQTEHHGTSWIFGILTFRTVTAALAFFGLCGLAAQAADASRTNTLLAAAAGGGTATAAVYWMMRGMRELSAEGTVHIQGTLGRHGSVYLRIPGNNLGNGKIQINLQNRTMDYLAVTSGAELPTGADVVVVNIVNPTTLEVRREE